MLELHLFYHFFQLFTWGCNDEGALGRITSGENGDEYQPADIKLPSSSKIVQTSAGDSHTAVLLEDGSVLAWGTFRVNFSLPFFT